MQAHQNKSVPITQPASTAPTATCLKTPESEHPRMSLVYMSGSGLDEKVLDGAQLRRGFNFLEKPFGERDLIKVLRQVLA